MSAKLVVRWYHVAPAVLALVLLAAWAAWRASDSHEPVEEPDPTFVAEEPLEEPRLPPGAAEDDAAIDFPRQAVTLYWPRKDGAGLQPVEAEIFATQRLTDRAKQIVELLLRGPQAEPPPQPGTPAPADATTADETEAPEPARPSKFIAPLPEGTRLRAAFVDAEGTAFVSLSRELTQGKLGGTARELAATYSVVNSLVRSLPEIRRVQFLVEGHEVESIGGHLDARFPMSFNEGLVAAERQGS